MDFIINGSYYVIEESVYQSFAEYFDEGDFVSYEGKRYAYFGVIDDDEQIVLYEIIGEENVKTMIYLRSNTWAEM